MVAVDLCVWLRVLVKESNKEIALARVARGTGVSEDYMIIGESKRGSYYGVVSSEFAQKAEFWPNIVPIKKKNNKMS